MTEVKKGSRQEERLKIISSVKGPVAYMMPDDIGKLVVRSSKISGYLPITPSYAADEIGVDNVKVLMATDNLIKFESFRAKGAIDVAHSHPCKLRIRIHFTKITDRTISYHPFKFLKK